MKTQSGSLKRNCVFTIALICVNTLIVSAISNQSVAANCDTVSVKNRYIPITSNCSTKAAQSINVSDNTTQSDVAIPGRVDSIVEYRCLDYDTIIKYKSVNFYDYETGLLIQSKSEDYQGTSGISLTLINYSYENGLLIAEALENGPGYLWDSTKYQYDNSGLKIYSLNNRFRWNSFRETTDQEYKLEIKTTFDELNRKKTESVQSNFYFLMNLTDELRVDTSFRFTEFEYNSKGDIIREYSTSKSFRFGSHFYSESISGYQYQYSENGLITEILAGSIKNDQFSPSSKKSFEFDENANLIMQSYAYKYGSEWVIQVKENLKYDNKNRVIEGVLEVVNNSDKKLKYFATVRYNYDDKQNYVAKEFWYKIRDTVETLNDVRYYYYSYENDKKKSAFSNSSLLLYPNPTDQILHIEGNYNEDSRYFIININGQTIQQGYLEHSLTSSINVQNLTPGIYTIKINDGKEQSINKFMKK